MINPLYIGSLKKWNRFNFAFPDESEQINHLIGSEMSVANFVVKLGGKLHKIKIQQVSIELDRFQIKLIFDLINKHRNCSAE